MLRTLVAVALTLVPLTVSAQTPPPASGPSVVVAGVSRLGFDHVDVPGVRYEQQVDDGPWTVQAAEKLGPGLESGRTAYRMEFLPMTQGPHTIRVRACYTADTAACGTSEPLVAQQVLIVAPGRLRIDVTP